MQKGIHSPTEHIFGMMHRPRAGGKEKRPSAQDGSGGTRRERLDWTKAVRLGHIHRPI